MLERDDYGAIFLHKAWNAYIAFLTYFCEGWVIVTKHEEFLQATCLLTYIDEFIFRIVGVLLLDWNTVRAAFHYIYLYHSNVLS